MRLSVHKDDPGYSPDAWRYRAYCDGVKVPLCFTADEELGVAWGLTPDPETGRAMLDPERPGHLAVTEYRGKVELRREA